MPTQPKQFGSAKRTTLLDAYRVTRTTHTGSTGSTLLPNNRMMTFLEPLSISSKKGDILYHLKQPVPNTKDDELQQEGVVDHLLAFHKTPVTIHVPVPQVAVSIHHASPVPPRPKSSTALGGKIRNPSQSFMAAMEMEFAPPTAKITLPTSRKPCPTMTLSKLMKRPEYLTTITSSHANSRDLTQRH